MSAMMPVFLAVVNLAVTIMMVVSAVLGWGEPSSERVVTHMYWGVATALLGLFGHTLTMFFFIGTSKAIPDLTTCICTDTEMCFHLDIRNSLCE